ERRPSVRAEGNPKPVRLDTISVEDVYLMFGNHTSPLKIDVQYSPASIKLHPKIRRLYPTLAQKADDEARKSHYPYFPDGPCVRLIRIIPNSRQLETGREEHGIILDLGPASWQEYIVLNELLLRDESLREQFANVQLLYKHGLDLSWCSL